MEQSQLIEIVLISVLAGALLPVLLQLRATLRTVQRRLDATADRLDRTLDAAGAAVDRVNRVLEPLDDGVRVRELVESVEGLSRTVNQLRRNVQLASAIGAAVVPAVTAAIRALSSTGPAPEENARSERTGRAVRPSAEAA